MPDVSGIIDQDGCYSLAQAAAVLQVDPRTVVALIEKGQLKASKLPLGRYGLWRVSRDSTHALLPELRKNLNAHDNT